MKFTLSWLTRHLDTKAGVEEIGATLTRLGLEVEGIDNRAKGLEPFVVGFVIKAEPHPNADRLRVCLVDTGKDQVQVVCGAPNARTGMKGVFAATGTVIPRTGAELKAGAIRGQASNGMLCSAYEMGLSDDHEGIIDLPADAPVGQPFAKVMGLDDPVIDVAVTPNRADCLGIRGIARDLAAAGLGTLKPLDVTPAPGRFKSSVQWKIAPGAESGCPQVVGRTIRGLKNGPSPRWLQDWLTAIGLRPISALVDVTNFTTHDISRPLHVFDADKLAGDLTMRWAKDGESLAALNGKTYALDASMVVIADDRRVHGIGGVMGGEHSGVTAATASVFIESALFSPGMVAATGRRLNLLSDARYRFERGLDPTSPFWGVEVATRLILEMCGGEASELTVAGSEPSWRRAVSYRPTRSRTLGGIDIPVAEQEGILRRLGFETKGGGEAIQVSPPGWRGDIEGEADIVEEVVRVHGLDKVLPVSMPGAGAMAQPAVTPAQRRPMLAKRTLAVRGLIEAVTFSFMPSALVDLFGGTPGELKLVNPIAADLDAMRPSIVANLLAAAKRNLDRGLGDPALFEVGPQYRDATPTGQTLAATAIRVGRALPRHWQGPARDVDAFDAKADALAVLEALGAPVENLQVSADAPGWYHPGQSGALRLGPNVLAWFGAVHPKVLATLDLKGPAVAVEVFVERVPLPRSKGTGRPKLDLSPFQPVERDFAFVVDTGVSAEALVRAARSADKTLIADARIFDRYVGDKVGPGKASLALSVTLQPKEATLTDEAIEQVSARIVAAVQKATGATLRT
ncbi:MAG: phenylalanine--tRNA ligase subunit beta [Alphaproteobacteria bacterium]|nr:phenylalanine--tRNA ligase subunit beta [Alphaproteobacteria bacterium]